MSMGGDCSISADGFGFAPEEIAACIDTVLKAIGTPNEAAAIAQTKQQVTALTSRYPLPYHL